MGSRCCMHMWWGLAVQGQHGTAAKTYLNLVGTAWLVLAA